MATLLAKKLSNQLNKLAEQAGLEAVYHLQNFYEGERRAAGCNGEIRCPKTGARVEFSSHVAWHPTVHIMFITLPGGEPTFKLYRVDAADAAEKIVSLLAPEPLTHDNLAKSRIANLPSLEHNPLLATYLSDASTGTATWATGCSMLERTILSQGFNRRQYTDYLQYSNALYSVARDLWNSLAQSCVEDHMVCHHLLAYHDVQPSETIKGRITYYQDDAKREQGIRTPIKVRKYLQKFFKDFRSDEELEQIAKTLDGLLQPTTELDVRLYSDDNLDGWANAYYHIGSCMNTRDKGYGVGELETYRCYCTSAMTDGDKSSGLTLAVLYQDGKPVARAITFKDSDSGKYYVRNYGDDRLVKWLDDNGYTRRYWLPNGTHLWTEVYDAVNDEYLSPYVDGNADAAKADITYIGGHHYWIISSDGVVLQNCCGYTCADQQSCDCCGEPISSGDEHYRMDVRGDEVVLCSSCEYNRCYTVDDTNHVYVSEDAFSGLIATNSQGYYTQTYFGDNDLVLTGDGDAISLYEAEYCPYNDEYYSRSDFTDLSGEPEFVRDTWAGYITDNNLVQTYLYRGDGTYIHDLDCRVQDDHVEDVLARLENEV